MVSGRTSTAASNPPRGSPAVSAAPTAPIKVSAGEPIRSVNVTAAVASRFQVEKEAEDRSRDRDRQAGGQPMADGATEHVAHERLAGDDDEVERAVLPVGAEQPVEAQKRGKQRARSTGLPDRCGREG